MQSGWIVKNFKQLFHRTLGDAYGCFGVSPKPFSFILKIPMNLLSFRHTGAQGSSVVKALLESGKYRVRGVTRNPESDRAQTLKDAGVELVKAEQHHCEEMRAALDGAYAAYVVRC